MSCYFSCYFSLPPREGTRLITRMIRDALHIKYYRESTYPMCVDDDNPTQIQHVSLPSGSFLDGNCNMGFCKSCNSIVDVILPPQCSERKEKKRGGGGRGRKKTAASPRTTITRECQDMISMPIVEYPERFFLNITSHKQWYDDNGTEQYLIIIVRNQKFSFKSKMKSHCTFLDVATEEDGVATDIINQAIQTFILEEKGEQITKRKDNTLLWDPTKVQLVNNENDNTSEDLLATSLLPSRNNVVLVSYETLMTLQGSYVKQIYKALGIESDHIPLFIDGNSKYERSKGKRSLSRSRIKRRYNRREPLIKQRYNRKGPLKQDTLCDVGDGRGWSRD